MLRSIVVGVPLALAIFALGGASALACDDDDEDVPAYACPARQIYYASPPVDRAPPPVAYVPPPPVYYAPPPIYGYNTQPSAYGYRASPPVNYPPPLAYAGPVVGDVVAYCMQRFRSYDPSSGTYLGYDGYRHPCP
jgi:BA14K-like protein